MRPRARARAGGCRGDRTARPGAGVARERRPESTGTGREQRRAVVLVERRHRPRVLALRAEAAPCWSRAPWARRPVGAVRCRSQPPAEMLGVVDQQQRPLGGERVHERVLEGDPRPLQHVERLGDRVERQRWVTKRARARPTTRRQGRPRPPRPPPATPAASFPSRPGRSTSTSARRRGATASTTSSSSRARPRNGVAGTGRFV